MQPQPDSDIRLMKSDTEHYFALANYFRLKKDVKSREALNTMLSFPSLSPRLRARINDALAVRDKPGEVVNK